MMKAFGGPNYSENADKCVSKHQPCAYCGKPVKNLDRALWVEICCGIMNPGPEHDPHGKGDKGPGHESLGGYPLGPECARKFRKEQRTRTG